MERPQAFALDIDNIYEIGFTAKRIERRVSFGTLVLAALLADLVC